MARQISESDWKLFRKFQPIALDRFCQRVLSEVGRLACETDKNNHKQYLALFALIEKKDKELAEAFNDPRRSTALIQLARIQSHDLLSAEEFACFSAETRGVVQVLLQG